MNFYVANVVDLAMFDHNDRQTIHHFVVDMLRQPLGFMTFFTRREDMESLAAAVARLMQAPDVSMASSLVLTSKHASSALRTWLSAQRPFYKSCVTGPRMHATSGWQEEVHKMHLEARTSVSAEAPNVASRVFVCLAALRFQQHEHSWLRSVSVAGHDELDALELALGAQPSAEKQEVSRAMDRPKRSTLDSQKICPLGDAGARYIGDCLQN
jgi:hypothetical protein